MPGFSILLVTLAVLLLGAVSCMVALALGRLELVSNLIKVGVVWVIAYFILLIGTSTTSETVVLEPGDRKDFCGAYVDCHLGITVQDSWRSGDIITDHGRWSAEGEFVFVSVEVTNNSNDEPLTLYRPDLTLIDDQGNEYTREVDLEFKLASKLGDPASLQTIVPASGSVSKTLIFEVPDPGETLRLNATKGARRERLAELFLIGDDDSLLHKPVLLSLDENSGV